MDDMRVVRGNWRELHGKKWEMKNRQREQMPRKTEIAMGDCIKSNIGRVRKEFKKNDRKKELDTAYRKRSKRKVR